MIQVSHLIGLAGVSIIIALSIALRRANRALDMRAHQVGNERKARILADGRATFAEEELAGLRGELARTRDALRAAEERMERAEVARKIAASEVARLKVRVDEAENAERIARSSLGAARIEVNRLKIVEARGPSLLCLRCGPSGRVALSDSGSFKWCQTCGDAWK